MSAATRIRRSPIVSSQPVRQGLALSLDRNSTIFVAAMVALALAQLLLGSDPVILALCLASTTIGLLPILVYGRDLYTCLAAIFSVRYTGAGLVLKTLYLQPVETYLQVPLGSYALTTFLIIVETAIIMTARKFDARKSVFPEVRDPARLRKAGLVAFLIGAASGVVAGILEYDASGERQATIIYVIASVLTGLTSLGLIAESAVRLTQTSGRSFLSPHISWMLVALVALSLLLNVRGLALNAMLSVFLVAFMGNAIRRKHVVIAAALSILFAQYLSPIALELRYVKYGMTAAQFASEVVETTVRAATDPKYIQTLRDNENFRAQFASGKLLYDYFGDGNNIASRLSFVALLDAVYHAQLATRVDLAGAVDQVLQRSAPAFLVNKQAWEFGYGDWLTWQLGLIETGRIGYLSFSLPMEGLALLGPLGLLLFPVLFMLPTIMLCSRLASWRMATVPSLFMFSTLHASLFEAQSDGYIALVTRTLPMTVLPAFGLLWLFAQQGRNVAVPTSRSIARRRVQLAKAAQSHGVN